MTMTTSVGCLGAEWQQMYRLLSKTRSRSSSILSFHSSSSSLTKAAPSQPWLVDGTYQLYQNGKFQTSNSTEYCYEVKDPASQAVVGNVPEMTDDEFNDTVAISKKAFDEWKHVPVQQRQRIMLQLQQKIRENTDDLAYLITLENGKTLQDAKGALL
jgi:delta 1-pyrroline-5-carboxylate dehydrogenase